MRREKRIGFLAAVLITLFLYLPSLDNDFIFDDRALTIDNYSVTHPSFTALFSSYRPLRTASYVLDYQLFGENPTGFRAMNILYHLVALFLLLLFLQTVSYHPFAVCGALLLFAIHPVNTEVVAYISGRRDLLSVGGGIGALFFFISYHRTRKWWRLLIAILFLLVSLASKETGAIIPLIAAAWLLLLGDTVGLSLRYRVVMGGILIGATLFFGLLAVLGGGSALIHGGTVRFHGNSPSVHYATALTLFPYYLKQMVFPVQLIMDNANYPLRSWSNVIVWLSAIAIVEYILLIIVVVSRGYRRIGFYLTFVFLALLPVSQIVPLHEIAADHYLYLPLVGICALGGEAAQGLCARLDRSLHEKKRGWRLFFAVGILLFLLVPSLFVYKSALRVREMRDIYTVLTSDSRWRPLSFRGLYTIGASYLDAGFPEIAIRYYRRSWETGYRDANLYGNIVNYYIVTGEHTKALSLFREWRSSGEILSPLAVANVAVIMAIHGDCEEAQHLLVGIPPASPWIEQRRSFVSQCDSVRKEHYSSLEQWLARVKEKGIGIEVRPFYQEELAKGDVIPFHLRMTFFTALFDLLSRYDVLAAIALVERHPDLFAALSDDERQRISLRMEWLHRARRHVYEHLESRKWY